MGSRAEKVYTQLNITADEAKVFDTVLAKLDRYFDPQANIIFERAKLNQRVQMEDETVEQFITSLYVSRVTVTSGIFPEPFILWPGRRGLCNSTSTVRYLIAAYHISPL